MGADSGAKARLQQLRRDQPWLDRVIRTQEHYGNVQAGQQAGAVTYFGFLSVFPVLALAVFVVGILAHVYADANDTLTDAINEVMPGLIGSGNGQLSLDSVQQFSGWAAVFGVLGVLYAGLGWLSGLRTALEVVFEVPAKARPNFVVGKLRDLVTLAILGITLLVAVALTGFVRGFSAEVLEFLELSDDLGWLVVIVTIVLGLAANMLLFYALFVLLGSPEMPRRPLWEGALLGAIGFEVLKLLSDFLIGATRGQPAAQAFGIALILVVWIHYFSLVVLYAAAFAHVSPAARALRAANPEAPPVQGPPVPPLDVLAARAQEANGNGHGPGARGGAHRAVHPGAGAIAAGLAGAALGAGVTKLLGRGRG